MNSSAIVMLVFAVVVLYGGLVYYMVRAAKGKSKKTKEE
jgi:flagellar basal body-associated protein FliL